MQLRFEPPQPVRVTLDAVHLAPDAEDVEGRDTTDATEMSDDLVRRARLREDAKRALREQGEARVLGAERPA
jgi:hypothetical protein